MMELVYSEGGNEGEEENFQLHEILSSQQTNGLHSD